MNLVILGGGTAGWLTALFCKKIFEKSNITLISNKEIGNIGVGEATTPPFTSFLKFLEIDPLVLIKETGGSIKNGISFENWNGDNKKYFHGFNEFNLYNDFSIGNIFSNDCADYYYKHLIKNKKSFNEYSYCANLSYKNKIDLRNIDFAIHFDTHKLSNYFKKIGTERNIKHIEDKFKTVIFDKDKNITHIVCDKQKIKCDFVFDCSGLARLILGNIYKVKWKSYKEYLPMKKAIPFYLKNEKEIKPYTQAIAMKYGWMWKIPLKDRIGAGYVYDSDYIDEKEAQKEAEEFLKIKLDIKRSISFEGGRHEKFWVNNCMSLGLSACFIEPLESTSIHMTVLQLNLLRNFVNDLNTNNKESINLFNEIVTNSMDEILYFIYLHYMTKRKDSLFWKEFKFKNKCPEKFKPVLEKIKNNNLRFFDVQITNKIIQSFGLSSYLDVCEGLGIFKKPINLKNYENLKPTIKELKKIIDNNTSIAQLHNNILI
tara:strand:- start:200 stop:1654 length:1455 start_codon:yes stop_codon:yes gene_type:complete